MSKYKSQAIPDFHVMEWLRKVRDEDYSLYKRNPEEYFRKMGIDYEEVKKSRAARSKEHRLTV